MLTEFSNDITLNAPACSKRSRRCTKHRKDQLELTEEQATSVTRQEVQELQQERANLKPKKEKKKRLREIDPAELSKLKLKFGENILAETQ